jgi:ElaB/YqjD/DUF883 family membrane-anchored ribosome-binding protein
MAERTEELKRDIESTRDHMSTTLDAIGDRVSPGRVVERRWNRVRLTAGRFGESVMGTPRQVGVDVRSRLGAAGDSAGSTAGSVGDAVANAPDRMKEGIEGNPLAAGAVAFGVGVLLGSLAPPSREEVRAAEQVVEPLKQEAQTLAQDVAEPVRDRATEALDRTRSAATEAAAEVKDQATSGTHEVGDRAASAGRGVAEQARGETSGGPGTAP